MAKSKTVSRKTLVNQPLRIEHNGQKYRRCSKFRDLGNGISEGPLYELDGATDGKWLYLLDLGYTLGKSKLLAMHRIQVASF